VQVTLAATDGGSGVGATRYTLDGSDPTPSAPQYTGPITLTTAATIKFRTWDLQGNPEQVRTQQLKIDPVAPSGQITAPTDGSTAVRAVTMKVTATDADSGVSDVQLFADGNYVAFTKASPYQFNVPAGTLSYGAHKLKALVSDLAGNRTWVGPVTINVIEGAPTTTIACDGHACGSAYVKGPVQVSLTATDGGGGISATRYTLDGSDPSPTSTAYTGPFMLGNAATVKFRSYDSTGYPEAVRSQRVNVDATPPTASISSPADGSSVVAGDLTVSVDAADAGSGMAGVELFVDGNYRDYSRSKSSPYLFTLPKGSLSLGTHRLKALVTDVLGNSGWSPVSTITIKDGLPTTTIACDGHACSSAWQKGPVQVSLSATDGGAGLGPTRYTLDGSDPSPASPQYSAPLTITGPATIKFRSWDSAGNPEAVRSQQLKLDAVGPTTAISSPADGSSVVGDVMVKVDASDTGSGVAGVELFVDGNYKDYSRSTASPYQITLAKGALTLGTHRLKALVSDAVGNKTWTTASTVTVKDGLPTTTIACDGHACSTDWQKGPVQVSLSAADNGAGVGPTRYTLDGSDPSPTSAIYSGPFTVAGTTTVKYRSWDLSGNPEAVGSQRLNLDPNPPSAAIVSPTDGASLLTGDLGVKVDASDGGSGVAGVELYVDGDYRDYSRSKSSPYELTLAAGSLALGQHRIKALVSDALGNKTWTSPVTFTLRDGLPATTIACASGPCPGGFVKGPATVTLTAIDRGWGVSSTRYTTDGSTPDLTSPAYSGPFMLTDTTTVKFRSYDMNGNAEPVRAQTIKVDGTAPTAAISSPLTGDTVSGDVTVRVDASDAGSGIWTVELYVDGDYVDSSPSKSSPYGIVWHAGSFAPGSHRLKVVATDALGNAASTAPSTVFVP
jgi:hypothetical protein